MVMRDTNWNAVSILINDIYMFIGKDFDDASLKLFHLVEVLDDYVKVVIASKDDYEPDSSGSV